MTPDQLTALAQRLRDHADDYSAHPDDACKHSDLIAAAEYLRQCAQAEPVAWMDDFGNAFPIAAHKGAGSWLDEHKRTWKPLYTHPQPQQASVPEGWKLVPVKPTHEMVQAAFDAIPAYPMEGKIRTYYRAMLAAAPQPPSAQADSVEALLRDAVPIVQAYARANPIHCFGDGPQDPNGAHAWLARAVLAAQGGMKC